MQPLASPSYSEFRVFLAGITNLDVVDDRTPPPWCQSFTLSGVLSVGTALVYEVRFLVSGKVVSLRMGEATYCSTVYSKTSREPLASLVHFESTYRLIVWAPSELTGLPDGACCTFTKNSCTVLDVGSLCSTHEQASEAIANAIKNAPLTLAGRLQGHINDAASKRRLDLKLASEEALPIPPFFLDHVPIQDALRPLPRKYVPASYNALFKLDSQTDQAPRDCLPCDVFKENTSVRVAVFRGASGSGKTMGALHAMDGHQYTYPNSAVLGLYTNTLLHGIGDAPDWALIANIIAEKAIADLDRWDTTCGKNLRGAPGGVGNLIVYLVADELGSYPKVSGCIINHYSDIAKKVREAICSEFCPNMSAPSSDGVRLYVSMAGTGLGLRADSSGRDGLPRNYRLILAGSDARTNILEAEMGCEHDRIFYGTVKAMCAEKLPDLSVSRNLLPALVTNARCAAFVGRHLKVLHDRFVRSREGIEDAMGILLSDVSTSFVGSNGWSKPQSEKGGAKQEAALTSLLTLAVTQPRGFHLLDQDMVITLARKLGAVSDVTNPGRMKMIPSLPLSLPPGAEGSTVDEQTEKWVQAVDATRCLPSIALGAKGTDGPHDDTSEAESLATFFDVSPAVVLIALQQRANDTTLRGSRSSLGYEAFVAALVTSAVDGFRRFLRKKQSSEPVPLHLIFGDMQGHVAGRDTIQLLPLVDAPLADESEWVIHPTREEVKAFGTGYDSWWPGVFSQRVAETVRRHGVALVFAGDGSPHRDGLLCTPGMVVDFDVKFHDRGETMALDTVVEKRCDLGFWHAKVLFSAKKVLGTSTPQWEAVGPVADLFRSQNGGVLSCLDEATGRFSFQLPSNAPKIAFSSAKAMFDMLELSDALAAMNGGARPKRVSLLVSSHLPLIPEDVGISLEQRIVYALGGAEEILRMAKRVYPQHPSNAATNGVGVPLAESQATDLDNTKSNQLIFRSESGTPVLLSDASCECRVARCVMSLEATLAFCSSINPRRSEASSVAEWPLDGILRDGKISIFAKEPYYTRFKSSGGVWVWETNASTSRSPQAEGTEAN